VAGDVGASGDGRELDLLRVKSKEKCQRGRQREGEEIGERRRHGVHGQGQNRPGTSAGLRCSAERFHGGQAKNSRGSKGRRGRRHWGIYRPGAGTKWAGSKGD
jgi:hypothetical protein